MIKSKRVRLAGHVARMGTRDFGGKARRKKTEYHPTDFLYERVVFGYWHSIRYCIIPQVESLGVEYASENY
jgi:hypothetical protein